MPTSICLLQKMAARRRYSFVLSIPKIHQQRRSIKQTHNINNTQTRYYVCPTQQTYQSSSTFLNEDKTFKPGERITISPGGIPQKKQQKKKQKPPTQDRPFIDRINLKTRGGNGGKGCISFHTIGSYKKKPSGGHGGKGGNVYLITDPTLSSLKMEKHHYTGQDGGRGGTNAMQGKNGKDLYVRVPCGVVARKVLDWDEMEQIYSSSSENEEEGESFTDGSPLDDNIHLFDNNTNDHNNDDEKGNGETIEELEDDLDGMQLEVSSSDEIEDDIKRDEDSIGESNEEDPDEEEEDFDTYYARLQSSKKRQRKRARKPRKGSEPLDYDEVVDTGIRSDDGYFHWSSPEQAIDGSDEMMASTAYPNYEFETPMRKTIFLADLDKPNSSLLVAKGGKAGVGNHAYANRPHFAGMGANAAKKSVAGIGESNYLELELKLIADVGLVGFPNAGKSSLLSAMSRARPKIASYPFTTLHPLVGSIQYRDGHKIVMADVPGLVAGAASGKGRGIEFLRHIERTKALVYMVDGVGVDGRDPVNDLKILGKELQEYGSSGIFGENEMGGDEGEYGEEMRRRRREIMNRPSLILANKMDLVSEEEAEMGRREELLFQLSQAAKEVGIVCDHSDVFGISAGVSGEGLRGLSKRLRQVVKDVDN